jgi:two-component system nitrogen regulation response regulator NtrX
MNKNWMESRYTLGSLVARSNAMQRLLPDAQAAANNNTRLLIFGETGVGKKVLARAIHFSGSHRSAPFVTLQCARLLPENVDRILFGTNSVVGALEEASEGTLVLYDIEELGPVAQDRMISVLSEETYTNELGETRRRDFRVIATADSKELGRKCERGSFAAGLFAMLSESTIEMPSLSEREADIPFIVTDILKEFAARERIDIPTVPYHYMELLTKVAWPENTQQLRNHLESVMVLSDGVFEPDILLAHFEEIEAPQTIRAAVHSLLARLSSQSESSLASAMNK